MISDDSNKESNNSVGWSHSCPSGLEDPADASSWQIVDEGTFKEQSAVKAIHWDRRPVLIAGATGQTADSVNGIYEPTGEIYNDRTLFRKKGDSTKWLRYVSSTGYWMVSAESDTKANNNVGWSYSCPSGLEDPADASSWQITDGSTFKMQIAVKAIHWVSRPF